MSQFFSESRTFHSPNRSLFVMDHERLGTTNFAQVKPILCEQTLPGDTWKNHAEIFMRFQPMLAPVLHRIDVRTESFYVPYRIIWPNFPKFLKQQSKIGVDNAPDVLVIPKLEITEGHEYLPKGEIPMVGRTSRLTDIREVLGTGSLADELGYQIAEEDEVWRGENPYQINILPFLAYTYIWHEYYRDENLCPEFMESLIKHVNENPICTLEDRIILENGQTHILANMLLLFPFTRAWEKDYFTSALPWTQKGAPVRIPINLNADNIENTVYYKQFSPTIAKGVGQQTFGNVLTGAGGAAQDSRLLEAAGTDDQGLGVDLALDNSASLGVNTIIQGVTGPTVNEFRAALQLQKWKERNALAGTRYTELLLAHWGVKSSDSSLQRPWFLGGSKRPVAISTVTESAQDSNTEQRTVGDMYGHGTMSGNSEDIQYTFEEHGLLIQLMTVMPRSTYMQGTRRFWFQTDELDFGWPLLANLGEQPVLRGELFNDGDVQYQPETFGYQERYCQYKFIPSTVHGDFRKSLLFWHLGRKFSQRPTLSGNFVYVNESPLQRIFNVVEAEEDPMLYEIYFRTRAIRELPYHAKPL